MGQGILGKGIALTVEFVGDKDILQSLFSRSHLFCNTGSDLGRDGEKVSS